ncbi:4-hydroxythreonine-4-phosphate dehydrogenase [Acinetobacter rudis CIP 110305]|uniref:4-hydroxythreonine-4-phosphate dehydrogenase n=2 Tax=Acinetobacter rudis TaxID=632955 RepID=S3NK85_9GAMM|nr:4-hydroxythreonine-4-phosphate dehydrogenase [Acinetobacter rudis CIP 110305]
MQMHVEDEYSALYLKRVSLGYTVMLPLYVTSGEPAGIGPDICLSLAHRVDERPVVVLADRALLQQRADILNLSVQLIDYQGQTESSALGELYVEHVALQHEVKLGELDCANAAYVLEQLRRSADYAMHGRSVGVATAPVQKSVINEAGIAFSGHTEYYQEFAGVERVVMMLATKQLRVALVTTHLALRDVADAITTERLEQVIDILLHDLRHKFKIAKPKVLVCGLNPHAGEDGYLGREEIDTINPVLQRYREQDNDLSLSLPADTLFRPDYLHDADAVLAMYHDQGLPVLKSQGFGEAINITLGLPFIRTSVDHGTALALAGTGQAKSSSLHVAVDLALELAHQSI